jgi:GAF domain-containing protein
MGISPRNRKIHRKRTLPRTEVRSRTTSRSRQTQVVSVRLLSVVNANLVTETIKRFEAILRAEGLFAAMRWLNERVPYRYSAVFGFDGDRLHNICLIDKENPNISKCPDQPITDSYCMYIQRSGDRFSVETALKDSRVAGHPKQRSFQCYYGIPLYGPDGQMLGTVCHFDGLPIRVTEEIASALDEVGPLIADAAFSVKTDR